MTDAVQLALITAVPPTLAILANIWLTEHRSMKASAKLDHITVLTNSTLTAANQRIESLAADVEALHKERADLGEPPSQVV